MTATCKSAIVFIPFSMTIFWSTLDNLGSEKKHSTETALIKIIDDLLFSLDNDKVSGMVLVDYINISLRSWRDFARECFCVVAKS